MPTQKTDRTTTWTINADNETWLLTKNATIDVNNQNGIYESGHTGSDIRILGDITVKGNYAGIRVTAFDSTVSIGANGRIDARQAADGIYSEAAGAQIINRGLIDGGETGVSGAIWSHVDNYGMIKGERAIFFEGDGAQVYNYGKIDGSVYGIRTNAEGAYIENSKGSMISGDTQAIFLSGSGTVDIVNHGIIRGYGNTAIGSEDSTLTLRNTGTIFGNVYLGAGNDIYDGRGGELKSGRMIGGDGDDTYYTSSSKLVITEESGGTSGYDEVHSTVSYKLGINVEELELLGKRDIEGRGNGQANTILGNAGDNYLFGAGMGDTLRGRAGNDILEGGAGGDIFVFAIGDDVDRIVDFEDNIDLVTIGGVNDANDFDDLDIKYVKGDLIINLGGGDKLIIEGLTESDFTFADIAI